MKDTGEHHTYEQGGSKDKDFGRGNDELISPIFEERLSKWLEKGAHKYAARNWEKGIPMSRIFRALKRHTRQYMEGWRDEDHLAAIACNIMFLIHYEEMINRGLMDQKIDDLPSYVKTCDNCFEQYATLVCSQCLMRTILEKTDVIFYECAAEGCHTLIEEENDTCKQHARTGI
jgi:hypothetical protein